MNLNNITTEALTDALLAAGHDIEAWIGDSFAIRNYAAAIDFQF
jgi:hypothetical protein